jgi:hypothetical protein
MLWRRHRKTDLETPEQVREQHAEASDALHKAQDDLRDTRERNHEITTVVTQVRRYGEQNNFADMIREAFGGAR